MKVLKMMEIIELTNSVAVLDNRGVFSASELDQSKGWVQTNVSYNVLKHTFRGMHLQRSPHAQSKLVKVVYGSIADIVVDLRVDSETYGEMNWFLLEEGCEVLVPKGFAHGFVTLEDHTVVQYLVDHGYEPSSEVGINWKSFSGISGMFDTFDINSDTIHISEKDLEAKLFSEIKL